uniref:Coiled-coil domain containing 135 n=1 Tax=Periophthalmus magnuspinnatus TaxID=409849 RepID=A0A3B4AIU9_9GOBI
MLVKHTHLVGLVLQSATLWRLRAGPWSWFVSVGVVYEFSSYGRSAYVLPWLELKHKQSAVRGHEPPHRADTGTVSVDAQLQYPRSYTENTTEEQHLLFIAQSFQRHFSLLYPERKPLLLCPTNECGVKKLVTTTLRPTMPGLADLCTWQQCARFVSNYLTLQPLEPPTELVTAVLYSQKCTSLEYANLLCSLLLGLNYNAYCVSGYASKHLCELDRSQESCPLNEEQCSDTLLNRMRCVHVFQEPHPAPDPLWGLRVHFWVLVLAGNGSVELDFFIEPLSGNPFPTNHPHFLGVESLWNELNVYVNMQDCVKGCQVHARSSTQRHSFHQGETDPLYSYDMPLSWCSMIHITDKELEMCWPGGFKVTHFKQALVENFIPFFCPDGVVTRLTVYQDPHSTSLLYTTCTLIKNTYVTIMTVQIIFQQIFKHLKQFSCSVHRFNTKVPEREMHFEEYRVDGLVRRLEQGYHMIETFEKRRDFLFQRHTLFDRSTECKDNVYMKDKLDSRPILKVVEKFHRDPFKDASEEIAERAFLLAERRIEVTYHLEDSTFIPAKRSFDKPTESTETQKAGDFSRDMVSTFQVLSSKPPLFVVGLFIRKGAMLLGEELRWLEQQQKELLAPVLMRLNGSTELRPDQAQEVYQNCLQDFKSRMVQHANLIQQRIHQVRRALSLLLTFSSNSTSFVYC